MSNAGNEANRDHVEKPETPKEPKVKGPEKKNGKGQNPVGKND